MDFITKTLNLISSSLLVPVIILLLAGMLYALITLGGFCAMYLHLISERKKQQKIMNSINASGELDITTIGKGVFARKLRALNELDWDEIHCEKKIADFDSLYEQELERCKMMMKFGPMFGLMCTLIPMGPALGNLAEGNISSMAQNMQIAFATTVIGLVIAAVGTLVYIVKRHWYSDEISNLRYVLDLQLRKSGAGK